jgi:hypothetical protein
VLRERKQLQVYEHHARRARDLQAARGWDGAPTLIRVASQRLWRAVRSKGVLQRLNRTAADVLRTQPECMRAAQHVACTASDTPHNARTHQAQNLERLLRHARLGAAALHNARLHAAEEVAARRRGVRRDKLLVRA